MSTVLLLLKENERFVFQLGEEPGYATNLEFGPGSYTSLAFVVDAFVHDYPSEERPLGGSLLHRCRSQNKKQIWRS